MNKLSRFLTAEMTVGARVLSPVGLLIDRKLDTGLLRTPGESRVSFLLVELAVYLNKPLTWIYKNVLNVLYNLLFKSKVCHTVI